MIFNKKIKFFLNILILCLAISFSLLPQLTLAAPGDPNNFYGLEETASKAGLDTNKDRDIPTIIGQAVNYLFGVIGVIFLTFILVGGYLWMTAGGNEEKVKKAKGFIINGINGMVVIFLAYALVYLILFALQGASTGG